MPPSHADLQARLLELRRTLPPVTFPAELPVSQRRAELAEAIRDNQVVIVAGETGSGKTTQLPKICLELGRGQAGQIGHTQPRRIAARSVAERIASELGTELGTAVGYKVRFADTASDGTLVKVMTDGILLTEMQRDRNLRRYDTLIIDEAHERSLNIDFILGYLKRLLPRRPDLKVIITSATIDPQRFAAHFGGAESGKHGGGAPVIEVSGRTYPVEVRYRPLTDVAADGEPRDQVQGIIDAVAELNAAGPGDILVFLSGEREIRDAADALTGRPELDLLPLYARLSAAEQHKVFAPHGGRRRVVLATNVAETSLTVPGIKYVIDPGTARISRYSQRTKVQRLPIEPISQASARQRAGRCGRTSDGICIRLYSEEDFAGRPEFTDPEILRTNLASVLLRMAALDLGKVEDFPFLDPPDARNITDGVRLLAELGAMQPKGQSRLTGTGRKLARLPVDPRLGRMILEAAQHGCVREVLIIAAALSIQDPRERPADSRDAADAMHRRFAEPGSDFLALLNLWDYLREQQRELSASAFRRLCRREYLHYLRVREWQDVYAQLRTAAHEVGVSIGADTKRATRHEPGKFPAELADRVHMSLLAGLLSHIGMQDTDGKNRQPGSRRPLTEFAGARGARFAIFPDSPLARKPPQWVMAAELVETSRLWARTVARIEPAWAEPLAPHLIRRSYSEPRWDAGQGAAAATEKVVLYGLPIVPARRVNLARIDPRLARDLFIQHALVEGDWRTPHAFLAANQQLASDAEELERKARRRGLVADDATLFAFYDRRIPADVVSARHFDSWWKQARRTEPELLTMTAADLAGPAAGQVEPDDYPDSWAEFPLSYEFEPGEPDDGVTVHIPLARLGQVSAEEFGWQVPGLRAELVTELIRSLPKQLRTAFVPAPDTSRAVLARLGRPHGDLLAALSAELQAMTGVAVPRSAWSPARLPAHLRISYQVTDGDATVASGRDLDELRTQLRSQLRDALNAAGADVTRTGLTSWTIGDLPQVISRGELRAYPALTDAGTSVDVRLYETPAEAELAMRLGTRRLIMLQVPARARSIAGRLPVAEKLAMSRHPYPSVDAQLADCVACAADQVIAGAGGPAWDAAGFAKVLDAARWELPAATATVIEMVARVLGAAQEAEAALPQNAAKQTLPGHAGPELAAAVADIRGQLGGLIYPGFVADTGAARLPDLVRYLRAIVRRLDKLGQDPRRDAELMATVHRAAGAYRQALADLPPSRADSDEARAGRWLIEELRVSLFAQTLGTPFPVSEKRIGSWLARLRVDDSEPAG